MYFPTLREEKERSGVPRFFYTSRKKKLTIEQQTSKKKRLQRLELRR